MLYQRGKAHSQDLRDRVFSASDAGARVGEVADRLQVSVSYVSKVLTRRRTAEETAARIGRGGKVPKLAALHDAIRAQVATRKDTTIEELRAWLLATHQVLASVGCARGRGRLRVQDRVLAFLMSDRLPLPDHDGAGRATPSLTDTRAVGRGRMATFWSTAPAATGAAKITARRRKE
jgi:hypothetical protein